MKIQNLMGNAESRSNSINNDNIINNESEDSMESGNNGTFQYKHLNILNNPAFSNSNKNTAFRYLAASAGSESAV